MKTTIIFIMKKILIIVGNNTMNCLIYLIESKKLNVIGM